MLVSVVYRSLGSNSDRANWFAESAEPSKVSNTHVCLRLIVGRKEDRTRTI